MEDVSVWDGRNQDLIGESLAFTYLCGYELYDGDEREYGWFIIDEHVFRSWLHKLSLLRYAENRIANTYQESRVNSSRTDDKLDCAHI